jgi:hypothetical protein
MRLLFLASSLVFLTSSCMVKPKGGFLKEQVPQAPDYSQSEAWASLPQQEDPADRVPVDQFENRQEEAPIDVFFLHPTTYVGKRGENHWNGPVDDTELNERTDNTTILHQASVFNGSARIYAPRYRQAHLHSYFIKKDTASALAAFELAYQDVARAFDYFLEHYNQGRPFILASHSQGTTHAKRLIKEYIDGQPLQEKLVVAYLVGIPVEDTLFQQLLPCETPDQTGCFCSWRTFKEGFTPKTHQPDNQVVATNPISWTLEPERTEQSDHRGMVGPKFNQLYPQTTEAQVKDGLVWVTKPKFPGSIFFVRRNYHIADYNIFYGDIRYNVQQRIQAFLGNQ